MSSNPIPKLLIPLYDNDDQFSLSNLINGLLLFDQVIIDSRHLGELKILTDVFSIRNVKRLIKSGNIDIKGGHITTGVQLQRVAGNDFLFLVRPMQLDPGTSKDKSVQELIEYINSKNDDRGNIISKIKNKYRVYHRDKLITSVQEIYKDYSDETFSEYTGKVHGIISEDSIIRNGILNHAFSDYLNDDDSNRIRIFKEGDEIFRINFNKPPKSQDEIQALNNWSTSFLLALGNIIRNNFNEYYFNCLIGLRKDEIDFQKLNSQHIYNKFNTDQHFERHERVLQTNNLPFVEEQHAREIKFNKLYKALNSNHISEYRKWLWNTDNLEDDELVENVSKFTRRADKILRVPIARKSLGILHSFLVSIATGDTTGTSEEVAEHYTDKYIFDKLKRKEHFTFMNDIYPSIFEK